MIRWMDRACLPSDRLCLIWKPRFFLHGNRKKSTFQWMFIPTRRAADLEKKKKKMRWSWFLFFFSFFFFLQIEKIQILFTFCISATIYDVAGSWSYEFVSGWAKKNYILKPVCSVCFSEMLHSGRWWNNACCVQLWPDQNLHLSWSNLGQGL